MATPFAKKSQSVSPIDFRAAPNRLKFINESRSFARRRGSKPLSVRISSIAMPAFSASALHGDSFSLPQASSANALDSPPFVSPSLRYQFLRPWTKAALTESAFAPGSRLVSGVQRPGEQRPPPSWRDLVPPLCGTWIGGPLPYQPPTS